MNVRTRVKFCGITRMQDARVAVQLGVDAIGLVCTPRSRRFVDMPTAAAIRAQLPPFVSTVVLFANDSAAYVRAVIATVRPDLLQFHGDEDATFCAQFGPPYLKALPMGSVIDAPAVAREHDRAMGFVLDGHSAGEVAGRGQRFDWSLVPRGLDRPIVLAGGLYADNVEFAIREVQPFAVDVASGIESSIGIKDAGMMRDFILAVRHAEPTIIKVK